MAKILTTLGGSMTVKVNNNNSVYSTSTSNNNITIYAIDTSVDSGTVEGETNFSKSTDPQDPTPIVSSKLTLTYDPANITPEHFIGFRISAASEKTSYTFTTTNTTEFTVPGTLPTIALSSADPTTTSVIWQQDSATLTGAIDIEISYTGGDLPESDNPLAINVDLFETNSLTDFTNVVKYSVSEDTSDDEPAVHNPLQVTVVTAELTPVITSHAETALKTDKNAFVLNDKIALKTVLTTNTATHYKRAKEFSFDEEINKAITLSYLYISKVEPDKIDSSNHQLTDNSDSPIDAGSYVAIDLSNPPSGVTIDSSGTVNTKVTTTITNTGDFAKLFDVNEDLETVVYVYFSGTIISSAVRE